MPRPTRCPICLDPTASLKFDGFVAAGASLGEIASDLQVSKFCASRHKKHVLQPEGPAVPLNPEERLDQLYDRCEDLYLSLVANGDPKAAADVLKVQVRLAEQMAIRVEAKQQTENESNDSGEPSQAWIDGIVSKVRDAREKAIAEAQSHGFVLCPACLGECQSWVHPMRIAERWPTILSIKEEYETQVHNPGDMNRDSDSAIAN